jgi:hypothetical protein
MIWDRDDKNGVSFHIRRMLEDSQTWDSSGGGHGWLNAGQCATLAALRDRLCDKGLPGTILADEVGMGKTRIAVALARAVTGAGGRAVLVVPPGLFHQWRTEFSDVIWSRHAEPAMILTIRSFHELLAKAHSEELKTSPVVILSHNLLNFQMKDGGASNSLVARYAELIRHRYGHSPYEEMQGGPLIYDDEKTTIRKHLIDLDSRQDRTDVYQPKDNDDRKAIISVALSFLGPFDLLVVDEAHKSKAADTPEQEGLKRSTLEKLLERLVRSNPRRLCMTATPFELDATNWKQILRRTGVTCQTELEACEKASRCYSEAARMVRLDPSLKKAEDFAKAADRFHICLSPWLLRRRKVVAGDDSTLERFVRDQKSHYRDDSKSIEADASDKIWSRAIMAVEALSLMPDTGLPEQRRVRFMLARNFSLATTIEAASTTERVDGFPSENDKKYPTPTPEEQRREARARFWVKRLKPAAQNPFTHPTLLAAVKAIEDITLGPSPEKVLVFGTYSQAIQRLTDLLNAREMLRRLIAFSRDPKQHFRRWHWPSGTKSDDKLFNAALEAACDMDDIRHLMGDETLESLLTSLPAQYRKYRSQREGTYSKVGEWAAKWLNPNGTRSTRARNDLEARLTRALVDIIDGNPHGEIDDDTIKAAWSEFCQSLHSPQDDDDMDPGSREFRKRLEKALEDFGDRNGFFARRLIGGMEAPTKQYLQSAFNRRSSWPMVLVAQSRVGREGLNLHRSCRTVVLFQPEWNPGVVEQQIGRVDRLGSLWEEMVEQCRPGVEPPKIRIMPVKFPGTYDDHNWQVLQDRWDSYLAQMNGEVFAPDFARHEHLKEAINRVRAAMPDFSPL